MVSKPVPETYKMLLPQSSHMLGYIADITGGSTTSNGKILDLEPYAVVTCSEMVPTAANLDKSHTKKGLAKTAVV